MKIKIHKEMSIRDFEGWGGAQDTLRMLIDTGLIEDFEIYINDVYADGISEEDLNDILRFEDMHELLSIDIDDEEESLYTSL